MGFGKQQNPQHSWDEKNVTSIKKNSFMRKMKACPVNYILPHDPLNMGAPRQEGMVPDTRIPLQPDNMPDNRTVPRPKHYDQAWDATQAYAWGNR